MDIEARAIDDGAIIEILDVIPRDLSRSVQLNADSAPSARARYCVVPRNDRVDTMRRHDRIGDESRHRLARIWSAIFEVRRPIVLHDEIFRISLERTDLDRHASRSDEDIPFDDDIASTCGVVVEIQVYALTAIEEVMAGNRRLIEPPASDDVARDVTKIVVYDQGVARTIELDGRRPTLESTFADRHGLRI